MEYKIWYNKEHNRYYIFQSKCFKLCVAYDMDTDNFIIGDENNKKYHKTTEFAYNLDSVKDYPKYIKKQVLYLFQYIAKQDEKREIKWS